MPNLLLRYSHASNGINTATTTDLCQFCLPQLCLFCLPSVTWPPSVYISVFLSYLDLYLFRLPRYLGLCLFYLPPLRLFCPSQLSGSLSIPVFPSFVLPFPAIWISVCSIFLSHVCSAFPSFLDYCLSVSFFPSYLDLSLVWLSPVILICACFASPVIWICLCLHLSSPFILISVSFWPPQLYGSLWLFSPDVIPGG